jgi:ribosome biogenesis GTPase
VESSSGISACKARGIFRKQGITPYAGDLVTFSDGVIQEVLPRKNSIIRPPLANLDQILFVVSMCKPVPNYPLLDQFLAVARYKGIAPVLILTKIDLKSDAEIRSIYEKADMPVLSVDYDRPETIAAVAALLHGKISACTGNSGVGKSTLLNRIAPHLQLPVGEVSEKLGRGRHTTRQATLYPVSEGYIADTPGFSTFEIEQYARIPKEALAACFPEFAPFSGTCRFSDCAHVCEKGCGVLEALHQGAIAKSRHDSYVAMYEAARQRKDWEK